METIPLTELENLSGAEPGELYSYAKSIGFKVVIWGAILPFRFFSKKKPFMEN